MKNKSRYINGTTHQWSTSHVSSQYQGLNSKLVPVTSTAAIPEWLTQKRSVSLFSSLNIYPTYYPQHMAKATHSSPNTKLSSVAVCWLSVFCTLCPLILYTPEEGDWVISNLVLFNSSRTVARVQRSQGSETRTNKNLMLFTRDFMIVPCQ